MVDPLGITPINSTQRLAPAARVAATPAPVPVASTAAETTSQSTIASTAREAAATPPVDLERVARIRKAITDGNFPIYPAQIADRLIAAKLDWPRHDAE